MGAGLMKLNRTLAALAAAAVVLLLAGACTAAPAPDIVQSAGLYHDPQGLVPAEGYDARAVFYLVVKLKEIGTDTELQASWIAVETSRTEPNYVIQIDRLQPESETVVFTLQNQGRFWPTGSYQVQLYQDGSLLQSLDFEVAHDFFPE